VLKKICVFCGHREGQLLGLSEVILEFAEMARKYELELVYGGASVGVMGQLAEAFLQKKLRVTGVIPKSLLKLEVVHTGLIELHEVESMHQRKDLMYQLSDAFCIFPGGAGTLDEFFEILTWKQLKFHQKPIVIFNHKGYYDSLLVLFEQMRRYGYYTQQEMSLFSVVQGVEELESLLF